MAEIDDEGLAHLAILASGVFDSQTVVLACLDELARRGAAPADLPERYVDLLPARLRRPEAGGEQVMLAKPGAGARAPTPPAPA